jgi:hypothetical protein
MAVLLLTILLSLHLQGCSASCPVSRLLRPSASDSCGCPPTKHNRCSSCPHMISCRRCCGGWLSWKLTGADRVLLLAGACALFAAVAAPAAAGLAVVTAAVVASSGVVNLERVSTRASSRMLQGTSQDIGTGLLHVLTTARPLLLARRSSVGCCIDSAFVAALGACTAGGCYIAYTKAVQCPCAC